MAIIALHSKIGGGKDTTATIIQALDYYHNKSETNTKTEFTDVQFCLGVLNNDYSYYSDWQIKKFADKLKDIVCILLGCTREQLECRDFKEKELGEEWNKYNVTLGHKHMNIWQDEQFFSNIKDAEVFVIEKKEKHQVSFREIKLTARKIMQLVGTECMRNIIHPDTWVNSLMSDYKEVSTVYKYCTNCLKEEAAFLTTCTKCHPVKLENKKIYPNWIISDLRFPNELKAVKNRGGICIKIERDMRIFDGQTIPYYELSQKVSNPEIYKKVDYTHESETVLDHIIDWDYVIDNSGSLEELIEKVKNILIKENIIQE